MAGQSPLIAGVELVSMPVLRGFFLKAILVLVVINSRRSKAKNVRGNSRHRLWALIASSSAHVECFYLGGVLAGVKLRTCGGGTAFSYPRVADAGYFPPDRR